MSDALRIFRSAPLRLAAVVGALALSTGCSTAHHARPLGKGNMAVHASIGGPIAGIGSPEYPIPLPTLTYKVGLTDRADVFVGWHVLETFLNGGNVYFDIGASYYLLDQKKARPGISAAFTVSPLFNRRSAWASFDLQVTASWSFDPRERTLLYVGFHNYFTPVRRTVENRPTPAYTWTPYLGGSVRVGKKRRLGIALELKWHRPYASTSEAVVGYFGPGKLGALGFMTGITVHIGKDTKPATPIDDGGAG